MALKGTLSDLGLVTLLQFPNSSRRSGLLTITVDNRQASLYYVDGNLVHATLDNLSGQQVLVEMVDWKDGTFSFETGITTDEVTIKKDLHRLIMWALKERDEIKKAQSEAQQNALQHTDGHIFEQVLRDFVASSPSHLWASVIDSSGVIIARSDLPSDLSEIAPVIVKCVSAFVNSYPGGAPDRVIIEDGSRTLGLMSIDKKLVLLTVVKPDTKIGLMCIATSRLLESVRKKEQ